MVNWILDFEIQVHEHGRKPAVIFHGDTFTYSDLNRQANRFANWLDACDASRVCIYLPNTYEVYVAAFGAMKAGATPAPINYMFGEDVVCYVLEDAAADVVLTSQHDAGMVAKQAKEADVDHVVTIGESEHAALTLDDILDTHEPQHATAPQRDDELFGLMYSSGTTGLPKGICKSHGSVHAHIKAMRHIWKISSDQTWMCAGPLYHTSGFESSSLPVLASGGTVVLHRWDIERFLREVETYQADSAYIAGSMLLDMLEFDEPEKYDVSSLKQVFSGGAPMEPEDYETVERLYDTRVSERLGMTEAGIILTYPVGKVGEFSPRDEIPDRIPGSCGKAMNQEVDIRIVDVNTGEILGIGEGEMQIKGDTLFDGYLNKPDRTRESFTEDGWYQTGDVVRVDEDGYFFHLRRADSMIVTGGENVYPRGVEKVLSHHPQVKENAVFPIKDDHWGERVCAAVVLKDDADVTADEIIAYCKESGSLAAFEVPKQVFFRDSLPKTATQSIRRPDLTKEYDDVEYRA